MNLFPDPESRYSSIGSFVCSAISIFVYYDMMFFVVNDGDNIWLNVLIIGLFEIPCLFIVAMLVEYGPRKVLYWMIYLTSGISAGAIFFTREGKFFTSSLAMKAR